MKNKIMKEKYYKVIPIKGPGDLPEEEGHYFVILSNQYDVNMDVYRYRHNHLSQKVWLENVEAYLIPVNKPVKIKGFLCFGGIEFSCPHCGKKYTDKNDLYLSRINRNKQSYTTVKCECGKRFKLSYDIMGNLVTWI